MKAAQKVARALNPERYPLLLYKNILRLHYALPPQARLIGDTYVKDEFKRHKDAKPEFVASFIQEWTQYCLTLSKQLSATGIRDGRIGKDLEHTRMNQLSDEQVQQLVELRVEADRAAGRDDFLQNLQDLQDIHEDKKKQ